MPHRLDASGNLIDLWMHVPGVPVPGGSKTTKAITRGGRFVMVPTKNGGQRPLTATFDDAKGNGPWKAAVRSYGKREIEAARGPLFLKPIAIIALFVMPRPDGHFSKRGGLLPWAARAEHVVKPDATKLLRPVEDALSKVWWRDDTLIVRQVVAKKYIDSEHPECGAYVRVLPLAEFRRLYPAIPPVHGFEVTPS